MASTWSFLARRRMDSADKPFSSMNWIAVVMICSRDRAGRPEAPESTTTVVSLPDVVGMGISCVAAARLLIPRGTENSRQAKRSQVQGHRRSGLTTLRRKSRQRIPPHERARRSASC